MSTASPKSNLSIVLAIALLALMTTLMFLSAWDDTPNADETVTVVSGYSYLQIREPGSGRRPPLTRDLGNPPLTEDLAALPLLLLPLHPPPDHIARGEKENDPDVLGQEFLYFSGNDPDLIMRAARAPMILFTIAFGAVLFWWTRGEFGNSTALLTLFLYAFSPTFLAHGRLVTTDVAAAAGFFVATIALLRFLKNPSPRNIILAGLAMGFAFLTKFSTIAMVPIAFILAAVWAFVQPAEESDGAPGFGSSSSGRVLLLLGKTLCVFAVAYLAIYPVYLHSIWPYAPAQQAKEALAAVQQYGAGGTAKDIVLWASDKPVLRPWAQYFLGIIVTLKASHWGQGLFFMGKILPTGFRLYFPFVYLVKEPLALHLLTLVAMLFALSKLRLPSLQVSFLRNWLRERFTEFALLLVLAVYWAALIRSNINLGVRHLLPAFAFTFVLVSAQVIALLGALKKALVRRSTDSLLARWGGCAALAALLFWQAFSAVRVHPAYLAYFNELVGGPNGGWRYVNDSNLDWGQDVKRLARFVERRNIPGIHVDVFGRVDPTYYLKGRNLGPLGCTDEPHGWVAVSAMVYPGSPWNPTCDYQSRLQMNKLVTKIGYSIFVFHVE